MNNYQQEIMEHNTKFPECKSFLITGESKNEKIIGLYCKTHKKYITPIQVKQ